MWCQHPPPGDIFGYKIFIGLEILIKNAVNFSLLTRSLAFFLSFFCKKHFLW